MRSGPLEPPRALAPWQKPHSCDVKPLPALDRRRIGRRGQRLLLGADHRRLTTTINAEPAELAETNGVSLRIPRFLR